MFTLTLATLAYEIALTRIFSVVMWYKFAFVAISVALLGLTIGALIVHHFPERFPEAAAPRQLGWWSLLFSVSIVPCLLIQLSQAVMFLGAGLSFAAVWPSLWGRRRREGAIHRQAHGFSPAHWRHPADAPSGGS